MFSGFRSQLGRLQEQQLFQADRRRAAERRAEEEARAAAARDALAARAAAPTAVSGGGTAAGSEEPVRTPGEVELREVLRLEALERRTRSLRAPSLVQTFRNAGAAAGAREPAAARGGGETAVAGVAGPAGGAGAAEPPPDLAALLAQTQGAAAALDPARLAGLGGAAPDSPRREPVARTVPGVTGPPVSATAEPAAVMVPDDPAGYERVYEGSLLSAVLVTQLSGEFAGPVLAQVSIPFYSADRQRILVPRGTRLLGTAQPVQDRDQSRLAVGFHRLVWPDGRWVDLAFHGLNAIGESALADQVNRHYWSMFAAAGAVGVLAGLTLQGSNPYAGGLEGFRAGAGQGFGQSATQILQRFLNRMPTITIRAGHRLRVWVTSDFLVPRPEPHPERMLR